MGFTVFPYSPPNWPELQITSYVCLDIFNPLFIRRNLHDVSKYDMTVNFKIYKSKADRIANPSVSIENFSLNLSEVDLSSNLSLLSYAHAKERFSQIESVVLTDDV